MGRRGIDVSRNNRLNDNWTHDPDYRRCYQTEEDVKAVLGLLSLDRASSLVDVGCGNGAFAVVAARAYPACRVWAFDALESAVVECRKAAEGLTNLRADVAQAHSIPLPDASVGRVLCRSVLHHIENPQGVYQEIHRVLQPGGRLVLQAPCNGWEAAFSEVLSQMMMLTDDSHRRYYYRPEDIVAGLKAAGFSVAGEPECWPYPFPFVSDEQAKFIRQYDAEERLQLKPLGAGRWSIDGCWVRLVAEKIS
jgi:ubiquinone/menaquinone biosynthesis C-methylase UbiE